MKKIKFLVSKAEKAKQYYETFSITNQIDDEDADVFVVLGGDGFMLQMMREKEHFNKPFYGINCGHIGFLMNDIKKSIDDLNDALSIVEESTLDPLYFNVKTADGKEYSDYAINEIVLMRNSALASSIRVCIQGKERITIYGDGVLLSTSAGSTAYNSSAGGPIIPLKAELLALTPLAAYLPKSWKGAVLKDDVFVHFDVLQHQKRPVNLTYDNLMIQDVISVNASVSKKKTFHLLFDYNSSLEERILKEQFMQINS